MTIILLFKHDTPEWTIGLLSALWILLLIPACHLNSIRRSQSGWRKWMRAVAAIVVVTAAVVSLGINVWPERGLRTLTNNQREEFIAKLKTQREPILVHLMCPPYDEKDCIVATQFIGLFEQSGWPVKGRLVDRISTGGPKAGLYFVLHSTVDVDISKPGTGAWTLMPPAYFTAKEAFENLIRTDLVVGASYPEKELGIYFGAGTAKP
jgi:hypothetical protein